MEFNPHNPIVKRCLQGMAFEATGQPAEADRLFRQAWNEAANDFEKFIAAYHVARHQQSAHDKLKWLQEALRLASSINDDSVKAAFASLYRGIAACYAELNDADSAKKNEALAKLFEGEPTDNGPFYHGTKADLRVGDLLMAGYDSNYQAGLTMHHIYFTALVNGAGLAAALAKGDGRERVYIVEPMGSFEHDPNVTNKKFPGNPTRSYRTGTPLKIVGEVKDWARVTVQEVETWRKKLENNKGGIIN